MDGHGLLEDILLYSSLGDGGPRACRRRGKVLPEKYLPGRFLAGLRPEVRAAVVRAVNSPAVPAPWFLRLVIEEETPRDVLPPPVTT
jgi:hypothetical protein